jgi:hypothetical protein
LRFLRVSSLREEWAAAQQGCPQRRTHFGWFSEVARMPILIKLFCCRRLACLPGAACIASIVSPEQDLWVLSVRFRVRLRAKIYTVQQILAWQPYLFAHSF